MSSRRFRRLTAQERKLIYAPRPTGDNRSAYHRALTPQPAGAIQHRLQNECYAYFQRLPQNPQTLDRFPSHWDDIGRHPFNGVELGRMLGFAVTTAYDHHKTRSAQTALHYMRLHLGTWTDSSVRAMPACEFIDLKQGMWGIARLNGDPNKQFFDAWQAQSIVKMPQAEATHLVSVIVSLSWLRRAPSDSFFQAWAQRGQEVGEAFSLEDAVQMRMALQALGLVRPVRDLDSPVKHFPAAQVEMAL